jgi:hypothetical protein
MGAKKANVVARENEDKLGIEYWSRKSAEEKLTTLQILREQYRKYFRKRRAEYARRKGLRRIHRTLKQT